MPQGVLGPSASASVDVAKDLLEITFSTTFSAADAIARYRAEAADYAKQSGYATYTIREVNVSSGDWGYAPQPMARMAAPASVSSAPLAVEPGKATVTATVNGTVQMK